MTQNEEIFLRESNAIEDVWDLESLLRAGDAWDYIKTQKEMSPSRIKKMHRLLMAGKVEKKYLGHYRDCDVFIGGRIAAPFVYTRNLIQEWVKDANNPHTPQEIVWSHIRYEYIHPFIDGNGRTGRMLMNWQRMRNDLPIMTIFEKDKNMYYKWFKQRPGPTESASINKFFGIDIFS